MSRVHPEKFAHAFYRTRRFDQMLEWYKIVFDATVQHQNPVLTFLAYDEEHHRFALLNLGILQPDGKETDKEGLIGVDHLAYTYSSIDDLFENYEYLKAQDIRPYWCVHHGVTVSMYYSDPDGNQMEFQIDCFETNDKANEFISGPGFSVNPIGVEFDPDEWLVQKNVGVPLSSHIERQVHEPVSPIRGAFEQNQPKS